MDKDLATGDVRSLCEAIAWLDDPAIVGDFLEDLCSIREIQDLAQRFSVAKMLYAGESYTAISEKTGASAATIARVSKCVNYGAGGYRYVLDNMVEPPVSASGSGSGESGCEPGGETV